MEQKSDDEYLNYIFNNFAKKNKFRVGNNIGKGGFGFVKQIKIDNKKYAGKLIKIEKNKNNETDKIKDFKGPNIVKVNQILYDEFKGESYGLMIMEEADLKDLKNYIENIFINKLNLIYMSPTNEVIGDNLLRFFTSQIVKSLEILDRNDYTHNDIKPCNFLMFKNLVLKLADYGLLRNPSDTKTEQGKAKIPGGTRGYLTPEFYENEGHIIYEENIKKQDYFALGSTLFYIKYGEKMLNYQEYNDNLMTSDYLKDLIEKAIDHIKSGTTYSKDFIDFLCNLINYKPEERYNIEEIYRNKWLNKNTEEIKEILDINDLNDEKLLIELNKSDYLIDKKNYLENLDKINDNDNGNDNDNKKIENAHSIDKKNTFIYRKNKFTFKRNKKNK